MPEKFKVEEVRRIPSADPARRGAFDRLVVFSTGAGNRDVVTVADEDFTEEKVCEAVRALLKERGAWIGKELEA